MTLLSGHNFKKDLEKVREFSSKIEKKLHDSDDPRIDSLTTEQLQDVNKILDLANYMLTKYHDKKDIYDILKQFSDIIHASAKSINNVDDDIEELILSTES